MKLFIINDLFFKNIFSQFCFCLCFCFFFAYNMCTRGKTVDIINMFIPKTGEHTYIMRMWGSRVKSLSIYFGWVKEAEKK